MDQLENVAAAPIGDGAKTLAHRAIARSNVGNVCEQRIERLLGDRGEQMLLGREVVEEGGLGDVDPFGDLRQASGAYPRTSKQCDRVLDDGGTRTPLLGLAQSHAPPPGAREPSITNSISTNITSGMP